MRVGALATLLMCLVACSHGKSAKKDDGAGGDEKAPSPKAQGRRSPEAGVSGKKSDPRAPKVNGPAEPMTTSKTTKKMFKPEGLKKLQETLDQKLPEISKKNEELASGGGRKDEIEKEKDKHKVPLAELDAVDPSGELDAATQEALRAFQRSEKLPETGLPDYESLRRLGLKPDEVYQPETPAEQTGVK